MAEQKNPDETVLRTISRPPNFYRKWYRFYPLLIGYVLLFWVIFPFRSGKDWGMRIFFAGLALAIFAFWNVSRDDDRHLTEQEQKAAEDPKHLFDNTWGIRYHEPGRRLLCCALFVMGTGILFRSFILLNPAFIFFGLGLLLAAALLWVIY